MTNSIVVITASMRDDELREQRDLRIASRDDLVRAYPSQTKGIDLFIETLKELKKDDKDSFVSNKRERLLRGLADFDYAQKTLLTTSQNLASGELSNKQREEIANKLSREIWRLEQAYHLSDAVARKDDITVETVPDQDNKLRQDVVEIAQQRIRLIGTLANRIKDTDKMKAIDVYNALDTLKSQMESTGSSSRFSFKSQFFVTGRSKIDEIMQSKSLKGCKPSEESNSFFDSVKKHLGLGGK